MIHIVLKGKPISTQNAYGQRGKIRYMKSDAKDTKNSYILQAMVQYKGEPLKTSLSVYIRLYFGDKRVRDWDNWHKISMDSLTGIVFDDDSQIKLATVQIMPPDKDPRIEVHIEEIIIDKPEVSKMEKRKSEIALSIYRGQTKNIPKNTVIFN